MTRYSGGFSEQDYERVKAVLPIAGPFTASDVLWPIVETGVTKNEADVLAMLGAMLTDLTDLGYLRRLPDEPPRWELAE